MAMENHKWGFDSFRMPKIKKPPGERKYGNWSAQAMRNAYDAARAGLMTIRGAAKHYEVPKSSLDDRWKKKMKELKVSLLSYIFQLHSLHYRLLLFPNDLFMALIFPELRIVNTSTLPVGFPA